MNMEPLERYQFDSAELMRQHPPRWHHRNKAAVFEAAGSSGYPFEGIIKYARWPEMQLPDSILSRSRFDIRMGVFDYISEKPDGFLDWYMNFADPYLFVAYESALLAQDELQVVEHPILGSLRDALRTMGIQPMTVDEQGRPRPVTISGVQRRCAIDTLPNLAAGRPAGLYGNAFSDAELEDVLSACTPLTPPTISNILALAAPPGGYGIYSYDEIMYIARAAFSGYKAAQFESQEVGGNRVRTDIHSGFWGCGAFGGNRTLMTILQALAGDLAGVDLKFYAFDETGVGVAEEALDLYSKLLETNTTTEGFIEAVFEQRFLWGVSDGN
jgi:Poly (ADP-ribose) glycohydrolase (PARG), Macro domain fold